MVTQTDYILDRESVRAVDRAAVEEYGIPGIVLMENAARGLADEALAMVADTDEPSILIVCGSGNNGGDGWAVGRHLHNAGVSVTVAALGEPREGTDAGTNCAVYRRMGLREVPADELDASGFDLVIDAIFGTGLDRPIEGRVAQFIERLNAASVPILAVDVPSGIDCDTGEMLGVAIRADTTVTFVAHKPAMTLPSWTGRVVVANIGAPVELLKRHGRQIR